MGKSNVYISIVLPTYMVEQHISKAIDSIIKQKYTNWELIVVNDGTTDRSAEIAREYVAKNDRICVIDKQNGGLSSARNVGLKKAKGKYVTFFDSDDFAEPNFLENLLAGETNNDPDIIIGGYKIHYESKYGKTLSISERDCPINGKFKGKFGEEAELFVNYAWNKLFKREFLLKNNLFYEEGLYRIEDAEFMSRVIRYNPRISFVRQSGYVYVQRQSKTLSNIFDNTLIGHSIRRVSIDMAVLCFFNNISEENKDKLEQFLKQTSSSALITRIYQQKKLSKEQRHKLLTEIRIQQLPSQIIKNGKSLKSLLKFEALNSLSKGRYWIVDLIYSSKVPICFK